jgi:hypothetical protein
VKNGRSFENASKTRARINRKGFVEFVNIVNE